MRILVLILAAFLTACATPVTTPRQGVAACYSSVAGVANTAADLDARGQLSPDTKAKIRNAAGEALLACDAAKAALAAGDVTQANGALKAAESILLTIEASLKR